MTLSISSSAQAERKFSTMRQLRIICARQWVMKAEWPLPYKCRERSKLRLDVGPRIEKIQLMILQRKEIEECIYSYKKTKFSLKVMAADYYDDTKNLKLFIQMFNFFDCSNQTCTTSVTDKIF